MTIEYGTLKNANVSIDSDDGAVWLWITSGNEHAGINLSAQVSDSSIEEAETIGATAKQAAGLITS